MQLFTSRKSIYIKNERVFCVKKCLCFLIVLAMLLPCLMVSADTVASKKMEEVLVEVKGKIDIPKELTEFSSYTSLRNEKESFTFLWQDKDGKAHMEITADDKGRIIDYYFFDSSLKTDKKITSLSKTDILAFVERFLETIVPEAFADENDRLVFDEESWNVDNLNYTLTYKRMKNGIEVKDNNASVRIAVYDDVAYVRNMNLSFKFDAEFDDNLMVVEDYIEKYKEAFPAEKIYTNEYKSGLSDGEKNNTVLLYRYKDGVAGYILASTGEIVTEDSFDEIVFGSGNTVNMGTTEDQALRKEMLTEAEIKELEEIEGLISKSDAEKILKTLPYIGFDNSLKISHFDIIKNSGKYELTLTYEDADKNRYILATFEGKTGEVLNVYQRFAAADTNAVELSEEQKNQAKTKIDKFLKAATTKHSEFSEESCEAYNNVLNCRLDRYVNGIRYIDNSITVRFDTKSNRIINYRLKFDDDKNFTAPENVIENSIAHDKLLEISELTKIYVHTGGKYKVCFGVKTPGAEIDAFSGGKYDPYSNQSSIELRYSDIKGHWAEEMINKLAEVQIGFKDEKFMPDEDITQSDLLRLFAAGTRHKTYLDFSEEELYRILMDEEIIPEGEKRPDSAVKREDAFVYMIRLEGLEKVAKLSEIFKVSYADQDVLTKEKTGYAAILTGMNIICGNGGKLRPLDNITRAEAAVMLYNYMTR